MNTYTSFFDSPVGSLKITSSETDILYVSFTEGPKAITGPNLPDIHVDCVSQLEQYFSGTLKDFNLALKPSGTDFQQKVWQALGEIPHGSTISYLELAKRLGDPKAIRAVAAANGKNKIAIIIPCHRVIGSDGTLVGYAGGLNKKEWLLQHEGVIAQLKIFTGA
jgi:methylated-DNA-[protein]-cysteine S-methyltransferase